MAASAPPGVTNNSWLDKGSSEDTAAIDAGISNMLLTRPPTLSGSSVSSTPGDVPHQRQQSLGSVSFSNSDGPNNSAITGNDPPSPSQATLSSLLSSNGNGGTKTLGSSSLVSTPSLYSNGDQEIYGLGRQEVVGSPWANSDPNAKNVRYSRDTDIIERTDNKDNGLMSLTALGEAIQTSPGRLRNKSVSPPGPSGDLSPLTSDGMGGHQITSEHRRLSRTPAYMSSSNSVRPPLSGHNRDGILRNGNFDSRNNSDLSFGYSLNGGTNTRPELRSDLIERLQGNHRRNTNDQYQYHDNRSAHGEQFRYENNLDHINKYGNLSNIHQQHNHRQVPLHSSNLGLPPGLQDIHQDDRDTNSRARPRLQSDGSDSSLFSASNSEGGLYNRGALPIGSLTRSISEYNKPLLSRSGSLRLSSDSQQTTTLQRRHTDFLYNDKQYSTRQQIPPSLQRRDNFVGAADLGAPVMATPEEMRAFNIQGIDDRNRSAGQRYQSSSSHGNHIQQGVHRHHTDLVSMSSSGSVRSGGRYVVHSPNLDDDLSRSLAGENLDELGDDYGISVRGTPPGLMDPPHHSAKVTSTRNEGSLHAGVHSSRSPYMSMDNMPPTAGSSLPIPRVVYNVKFKRTQRCFIIGPRVTRDLKIGCYVKVEADRGEDLGIVVAKVSADKYNSAARSGFRAAGSQGEIGLVPTALGSPGISDLKRIIRLATHDEVSLLNVKREEEEELLKICRAKVRQRALPMHVVDAEYQFDRHKLTFFFEAEGRIDFRELVRDLFSMYKTRIWMQQLDKNGTGVGSSSVPSLPDYGNSTMDQIPVMAENITEPYGISVDTDAGSN